MTTCLYDLTDVVCTKMHSRTARIRDSTRCCIGEGKHRRERGRG